MYYTGRIFDEETIMYSVIAANSLFYGGICQVLQSDFILQRFACLYFKRNYFFLLISFSHV
jgi:hypothetical protein